MTTTAGTTYQLEGRLLEVCSCDVLCPCWVEADPDGGTCDAAVGWHIDNGTIQGVAEQYTSRVPALGHDLSLQNHNAIQGTFRFVV